jgi:hypothetical protein
MLYYLVLASQIIAALRLAVTSAYTFSGDFKSYELKIQSIESIKEARRLGDLARRNIRNIANFGRVPSVGSTLYARRAAEGILGRRTLDAVLLATYLFIIGTVELPWAIGRYLMRDTFLYPRDLSVEPATRLNHVYFLPDYLAGLTVISIIASIILLAWPWRYRSEFTWTAVIMAYIAASGILSGRHFWALSKLYTRNN